MNLRQSVVVAFFSVAAAPLSADFTPGALYITANGHDCFLPGPTAQPDRIYEFDPATGAWKLFAELPKGPFGHCGLNGMAFTPDGKHLRVSSYYSSSILQFAGDGTWTVALDASAGIAGPAGGNNIGYDSNGDFFVFNYGGWPDNKIMKFPGGSAPGTVFAGPSQGVSGGQGPIAIAPDGALYYNPGLYGPNALQGAILRYSSNGAFSVFDILEKDVGSLAIDREGNLYLNGGGTWKYPKGDPDKKELLWAFSVWPNAIAVAADQQFLYGVDETGPSPMSGRVWAIHTGTGEATLLSVGPGVAGASWGWGLAVCPRPLCAGDLNGDGEIDQADLGILLSAYGACPGEAGYNAKAGNLAPVTPCVDQADLGVLLGVFGTKCE